MSTDAAVDRRLFAAFLLVAAVFLFLGLGQRDLWAPDEPRYAQVAEELRSMQHGMSGLVLLHLNGEVYTQKPPLYFWLAALAGAPSDRVTETAARLPSAAAGFFAVMLTTILGARLVGARAALCGAALLLTSNVFADNARRAQLDALLTLFETLALFAFWRLDRGVGRRVTNILLLHGSLGLGVLTKGPVGLLIPLFVIAGFLLWERRLSALRHALPLWSLPLSLGPGLLWITAAVTFAPAGYFGEAVFENLIGRFFEGTSHKRPFYYFLYQLPLEFMPWSLLLPLVYRISRGQVFRPNGDPSRKRVWRFLLSWVGVSLLFFSCSSGKRGIYLLPSFPALALLCAQSVECYLRDRRSPARIPHQAAPAIAHLRDMATRSGTKCGLPAGFHTAAGILGLSCLGAGIFFLVQPHWGNITIPSVFCIVLLAVAIGGTALWEFLRRSSSQPMTLFSVLIAALLVIELNVFALFYPALDGEKSPRPIAQAAVAAAPPDTPIGLVSDHAFVGGLRYYSGRPIAELHSKKSIRQFLARGGRAMVVKERKLSRITAITPADVQFRGRSGRRTIVVVTPRLSQEPPRIP